MKINFKFSIPYENALDSGKPLPKDLLIRKKIKTLKSFWSKNGKNLQRAFKKITNLSFKRDVDCYINTKTSLSDPLSLKILPDLDMTDNFVHELCHVILTQNEIGKTQGLKKLFRDFKDEKQLTKVHLLVHSIHLLITRTDSERKRITEHSKHPDYIRSWELVFDIGAENLVKKYLDKKSG